MLSRAGARVSPDARLPAWGQRGVYLSAETEHIRTFKASFRGSLTEPGAWMGPVSPGSDKDPTSSLSLAFTDRTPALGISRAGVSERRSVVSGLERPGLES